MTKVQRVRLALIAAGIALSERLGDDIAAALRDGLLDDVIKAIFT